MVSPKTGTPFPNSTEYTFTSTNAEAINLVSSLATAKRYLLLLKTMEALAYTKEFNEAH